MGIFKATMCRILCDYGLFQLFWWGVHCFATVSFLKRPLGYAKKTF